MRSLRFAAASLSFISVIASAQTLRQMSFTGQSGNIPGQYPETGLIQDSQGNFYGSTFKGGRYKSGEVYEITVTSPNSAKFSVLYSFGGSSTDGVLPIGNLVIDASGSLYGVTEFGGTSGCACGTVFQLSPPSQPGGTWTESILYSFQGSAGNDGATPLAGLVFDTAGNLYGTLSQISIFGNANNVYELSPPSQPGGAWTETGLAVVSAGGGLACTLVMDPQGNLYGTTNGGSNGKGSVFEVSPPSQPGGTWTATDLHDFQGYSDGENPVAGLTLGQGKTVALFGTTSAKPTAKVFVMFPPPAPGGNWVFETVYADDTGKIGSPVSPMVWGAPNTLYGVGGNVIWELSYSAGVVSVTDIYFLPTNTVTPVLVGNHALYGTTLIGGTGVCSNNGEACGTVFELTP